MKRTEDVEKDVLGLKFSQTDSKEKIMDMTYDWQGQRLVVATVDKRFYVYNLEDGQWLKNSESRIDNSGPILKVKWANPCFGNFIATCRR